jgi:hypothetical protein
MSYNIALPRQRGKTTWAIMQAAHYNAYLVVPNQNAAYAAVEQAKSMGLDIRFPMTFAEFLDGRKSSGMVHDIGFVIDNIDLLIQHMTFHQPIFAMTMTGFGDISNAVHLAADKTTPIDGTKPSTTYRAE